MKECMLCKSTIGFIGICENCGLSNNVSKEKNGTYNFVFADGGNLNIPIEKGFSMKDYLNNHPEKCKEIIEKRQEEKISELGYEKGKMCPFTQVSIGGTKNFATIAMGGPAMNEYTWQHSKCIEEYCSIWDEKKKRCGFRSLFEK